MKTILEYLVLAGVPATFVGWYFFLRPHFLIPMSSLILIFLLVGLWPKKPA